MSEPRVLLLFDPEARPQNWNERMAPGEYAVLYSGTQPRVVGREDESGGGVPACTVFGSLAEAKAHAAAKVAEDPALRCRIYDQHGLAGQPVREIRGTQYKGESEISARFRRWGGSILLVAGIMLWVLDEHFDLKMGWPAAVAARIAPLGLILLVTELVIVVEARRQRGRSG
ncbi:hypothetical protein EDE15_3470 [Edaphobacter aggregans]|uniref:Uncharacterized protein n=1 Tax=Edaphobacter aggregans TaxID=570835 RepID=A0A3R9WID9_9BACT|nr:hypothetical protein [Edaphobacter aggregans]RSL17918.1 hypothetical protein EDE15_3470 [Edaphobacter aggregans]